MSKKQTKEELPKRHVGSTTVGTDILESVIYRGIPAFLVYNGKNFSIHFNYRGEDEILLPLGKGMFPYRPYSLNEKTLEKIKTWNPTYEQIYQAIYGRFDIFLDLEKLYKILLAVETLESYQQQKIETLSYLGIYGDVESGKTLALELLALLGYRPLLTVDLTPANIFNYIGYREQGTVMILEDEVHTLNQKQHPEKMAIYKSGYRKDAKVARIIDPSSTRKQRFYNTFCSKCLAGEWIPSNKALRSRCLPVPMIWGIPKKEKISEEDKQRMDMIKLGLLVWRMRNYWKPLPNVESGLTGRMRELWESKLQIITGLSVEKEFFKMSAKSKQEKLQLLRESLEAYITKAVIFNFNLTKGKEIPFSQIWKRLVVELGVEWNNQSTIKDSFLGFDVTKKKVGGILHSVFNGKRDLRYDVGRVWKFQRSRLEKLMKKYGLDEVDLNE